MSTASALAMDPKMRPASSYEGFAFGRPRSHSEAAAFLNSFDYSTPYAAYNGKNGADLALELLGAQEAPFDAEGQLVVPAWVGKALSRPYMPKGLSNNASREQSKSLRRYIAKLGTVKPEEVDGIEEIVALGMPKLGDAFSDDDMPAPAYDDPVPRLISELVEDHVVPQEFVELPPEEIAKMFQINPRQSPRNKPLESNITYSVNAEGRTVIQYATLSQVVKAFSSDAQGTKFRARNHLAHH